MQYLTSLACRFSGKKRGWLATRLNAACLCGEGLPAWSLPTRESLLSNMTYIFTFTLLGNYQGLLTNADFMLDAALPNGSAPLNGNAYPDKRRESERLQGVLVDVKKWDAKTPHDFNQQYSVFPTSCLEGDKLESVIQTVRELFYPIHWYAWAMLAERANASHVIDAARYQEKLSDEDLVAARKKGQGLIETYLPLYGGKC